MHSPVQHPIPVDTLLLAYRSGIFPMADKRSDQDVFWVEPRERAVIPLDGLHVSKSLRKTLRADRFTVTLDTAFERVIRACAAPRADHPESWISDRIIASYVALHRAGYAHSIECWANPLSITERQAADAADWRGEGPELVGGLYGVAFDGVFCGESMFSRVSDASKVALCWLVALLRKANYRVLDCQFMTDHLASMGAIELPQAEYRAMIQAAIEGAKTAPILDLSKARAALLDAATTARDRRATQTVRQASGSSSSPGKRIAQSLTQTS